LIPVLVHAGGSLAGNESAEACSTMSSPWEFVAAVDPDDPAASSRCLDPVHPDIRRESRLPIDPSVWLIQELFLVL
jgi:hypothetical protein